MKALMKIELERAFKNKWFYVSVSITLLIVLMDIWQNVLPIRKDMESWLNGSDYQCPGLYMQWMELNLSAPSMIYHFIIPLLAALPYSMSIYTDAKTHYMNNIVTKIEKKKYYLSKLITQFISGGCIATLPLLCSFIITAMILPAIHPVAAVGQYPFRKSEVFGDLFFYNPLLFVIVLLIIDFIGFGLINCIAYIFADLLDNKYMVALSPFIIYFLQYVVCSMIGRDSIRTYLQVVHMRVKSLGYIWLDFIILIAVIVIAYIIRCKRKNIL